MLNLVPVSFTIDEETKTMNLVLSYVSALLSDNSSEKTTGAIGLTTSKQSLFKIAYYIKQPMAEDEKEELVFNAQFVNQDSTTKMLKSFATPIPQNILEPHIDLSQKSVQVDISVKQGALFDFIIKKDSVDLEFNAMEYESGNIRVLKKENGSNLISHTLKTDAENSVAILIAVGEPKKIWSLAYFKINGVKIDEKKITIQITFQLDKRRFLKNYQIKKLTDSGNGLPYGLSVYRLRNIYTLINGHPNPDHPNLTKVLEANKDKTAAEKSI